MGCLVRWMWMKVVVGKMECRGKAGKGQGG